jgi:MarR family transcriptional regulator, organic hydroperoxide resistance regulator
MSDLRNSSLFLLSRTALRASMQFETRELARHNISLPMYRALVALLGHDDQRLGDLSALADIEMSTLSRLIGTMQARRLVTRRRSGKDARAVRIRITEQGRALAVKLVSAAGVYEADMTRGIAARDIQALKRTLERIGDVVDALAEDASARPKPRPQRRASAA